jgi:phosphatidate cytidylyltransferase
MSKELILRIISSIIIIPITLLFIIKGSIFFNLFLFICYLITLNEWHQMTKKNIYNIFGLVFITVSYYCIYSLRIEFNNDYFYILFVTLICVSTDIGGYIFGKFFRGPKLTKLSPNKTYSGMIGSYLFSLISINYFINSNYLLIPINFSEIFIALTLIISTISQLGDVLISYFKRLSKLKDTGKLIPGHGGILDRIDGMIFAFPFFYILIKFDVLKFF